MTANTRRTSETNVDVLKDIYPETCCDNGTKTFFEYFPPRRNDSYRGVKKNSRFQNSTCDPVAYRLGGRESTVKVAFLR